MTEFVYHHFSPGGGSQTCLASFATESDSMVRLQLINEMLLGTKKVEKLSLTKNEIEPFFKVFFGMEPK